MIRIWYHKNCLDGFASAWAAHKKFGPKTDLVYEACQYGDPPPEYRSGDTIYILDFSYPRQTLLDIRDSLGPKGKIQVLDHHKSAREDLEGLDFAFFDMDRSGAGLSWDYFFKKTYVFYGEAVPGRPRIIEAVQDRDLWRFQRPDTKQICTFLDAMPWAFHAWDRIEELLHEDRQVVTAGQHMLDYQASLIRRITGSPRMGEIGGHPAAFVNTKVLQSESCHLLLKNHEEAQVAVAYSYDLLDGKVVLSLRSREDGPDVSLIAKELGGGGHKHAAGAKVDRGVLL